MIQLCRNPSPKKNTSKRVSSLQLLRRLPQGISRLKGDDAIAVSKDDKRSPTIDHVGPFQDVVENEPIYIQFCWTNVETTGN